MLFCCGLGRSRPKASSSKHFDPKSFCDYVHDMGRAYRHRSIELIKICQRFSAASEQRFHQDAKLTSALEKCDAAIERAIKSQKKTSQESDSLFEMATRDLNEYGRDFHNGMTISVDMSEAEKKDAMNMYRSRNNSNDHTMIDVEFHILSSLPRDDPIIVKQKLSNSSGASVLPEILWNFSHFEDERCLRLSQNPHFYIDLPNSPTAYGGAFSRQPTEIYKGTIYVLTNNLVPESGDSRRVFFEFGGKTRAFDNFWNANNTLIFKDVTGRLEGETLVERSIPDKAKPPFKYHMVRMNPSPPQEKSPKHTRDWRVPIRELLGGKFSHTHVRIASMKHK